MLDISIILAAEEAVKQPIKVDTFAITVIFIAASTMIAAFVRRRQRDKCLRDFEGELVTFEDVTGKLIWGRLDVENTGIEIKYAEAHDDADGHQEKSYLLYKNEFGQIQAFSRFHDQLSETEKKVRLKQIEQTYHPGFFRRSKRKIINLFKTVRDSVLEVVNLLVSRAKTASPAGGVMTAQDKYVTKMKSEMFGAMGASFEPLLEKHIGNLVVLEMLKAGKVVEYSGVLKDYTSMFIEIMDVEYDAGGNEKRRADIVVPRKLGIVRHVGE
ncbi:MAG: hypothetical protein KAS23_10470 [Anaerohalosphaera sp.]|nr:hypothetical protein [Anaerohalosphaera sp.]